MVVFLFSVGSVDMLRKCVYFLFAIYIHSVHMLSVSLWVLACFPFSHLFKHGSISIKRYFFAVFVYDSFI